MFCPNCGTQNDSAATPCKKCGFKLSGISVPKFKGTMMLNSDQTVQELIEEHRRKQAEAGAADKSARKAPGSSAPPSSLSSPRGPVFQPPRAAAPSRGRMGGTMMGVAPQAGGVAPPPVTPVRVEGVPAPVSPAVPTFVAPPPAELPTDAGAPVPGTAASGSEPAAADRDPTDALAGTVPVPIPEPAPPDEPSPPEAIASDAEDSPLGPGPTRPLAAVPPLPALADVDETSPGEAGALDTSNQADSRVAETQPPRHRDVAATLALPQHPAPAQAALEERGNRTPPRIRPLDVVLIVCTLGLYGIVLWFKQRTRPA